jgi:(1->4)-alpha-D-glucan 1-alpha-D-glucosylmutase
MSTTLATYDDEQAVPVEVPLTADAEREPGAAAPDLERALPAAVYRLQLHREFTFSAARRLIGYLNALGISDCYVSPVFKARAGSRHGYDIVDHSLLNPEIGTQEEFESFAHELKRHDMGLVFDVVPNHMGISSEENHWWYDVLENGSGSSYAGYFDIDWSPQKDDLKDKVLLPVLGDQYGKVLEEGSLALRFEGGSFQLQCYDRRLPISPHSWPIVLKHRLPEFEQRLAPDDPHFGEFQSILFSLAHIPAPGDRRPEAAAERRREKDVVTRRLSQLCEESEEIRDFLAANVREFNGTPGQPKSFDLLDELLVAQPYRLAHWQVAADEINYRRFFDVNDLAALRMENEDVFHATHALIERLAAGGFVSGLRVDHPDGLFDPAEYLRRLQPLSPHYVVVEKILEPGEPLPADWPVQGTTGYEFLNSMNGLFVDRDRERDFDRVYTRFVRESMNYRELVARCKNLIMKVSLSSEIGNLGHQLDRISERDRKSRDFTLNSLTGAIREIITHFPIYRTYVTSAGVSDRDRRYIELATARAKRKNPAISASIFDFVRDTLLLKSLDQLDDAGQMAVLQFVGAFQQTTGPVMAKSVEDTAFYIYNRLVSLNEVGGDPERFGVIVSVFHRQNADRQAQWPFSLLTTTTHDTKRSEDVRARINALSELPADWKSHLARWAKANRSFKSDLEGEPAPSRNDEYLLYQTLVGTWPAVPFQAVERERYVARIQEFALKAVHEAKVNTSWVSPHEPYERSLREFIAAILTPGRQNRFLFDFEPFARRIADLGIWNSLSQTLIKLTSPGIPDVYQGSELFDFRLVDPDNRGPVDFTLRAEMLEQMEQQLTGPPGNMSVLAADLISGRTDGRVKLYLIRQLLHFRRAHPDLFTIGEYLPLEIVGERKEHVVAYLRRLGPTAVVVAVPRLVGGLVGMTGLPPFGREVWSDTAMELPAEFAGSGFINLLTGESINCEGPERNRCSLAGVFSTFPVAALESVP